MFRSLFRGSALLRCAIAKDAQIQSGNAARVAARQFSAAAAAEAAEAEIAPPKQLFSIPGRYASALYVAAAKRKQLDAVESEVTTLVKLAEQVPAFGQFLKDPIIKPNERMNAIKDVLESVEASDVTRNFLFVLTENGRLSVLPKVVDAFEDLMREHRKEVKVIITSAVPLSDDQRKEMGQVLQDKYTEAGQSLKVEEKVDESILGGLVIDIGDKHVDLSIATRIRKFEAVLRETI